MATHRDDIEEEAIGWIIRTGDPGFADWEAFTRWLEADPAHNRAYERLALADQDMADALQSAPPPHAPAREPTRRIMLGWAIAATIVGAGTFTVLQQRDSVYSIETVAGARRTVTFADGSRAEINGGTRLMLDRDKPRWAKLERGEAVFTVVHDTSNDFVVETGGARLVDAGTIFNVSRLDGVTEVAVAEGAIIYNPSKEAVRLDAGRALRASDDDRELRLAARDPASVASWRQGQLVYDGVPIGAVAADIERNLGIAVSADPSIAARPFSGVIQLGGDREAFFRQRLGPIVGGKVERRGGQWVLTAG